jgi:alkanesulfonate monooxygenase SsuD/methylene tetrahydromethanopterin reductase-like flavin-dependent oxidoreductase (luciferase family)
MEHRGDEEPRDRPSTRYRRLRESVEALRVVFTEPAPEYHGEIIDCDPMPLVFPGFDEQTTPQLDQYAQAVEQLDN